METEQTSGTSDVPPSSKQENIHISIQTFTPSHDVVESSQVIGPHDAVDNSHILKQSSWICQVHDALADTSSDIGIDPSQVIIRKVPAHYRTNPEHYEPEAWRFGLHHRPLVLRTNGTEGLKVRVARALQLKGEQWDSFCKYVVQEPKSYWEGLYADNAHIHSYTIEEIRYLLSLDALFLVVFLQFRSGKIKNQVLQELLESPIFDTSMVLEDLMLVENQIPMELMKRAVGKLRMDYENIMPPWKQTHWERIKIGCCDPWSLFTEPMIDDLQDDELLKKRIDKLIARQNHYFGCHIFENIYDILCGPESMKTDHAQKPILQIPTASCLESCGMMIKAKEFTDFEDISFENGCLSIPFLPVYNYTEKYLRNLVVHEELTKGDGGSARAYTCLMDDLMKTPDDVKILVNKSIVFVYVGPYENVVDMWNRVNHKISTPKVSEKYHSMLTDVTKYASQRRNKFRFEFMKTYCSRPWILLSVLAAIFVTIATGVQTYTAIISSNGMKPTSHH